MKPIELIFFAVAVLLPLVGGGALLYLLSRGSSRKGDENEKK